MKPDDSPVPASQPKPQLKSGTTRPPGLENFKPVSGPATNPAISVTGTASSPAQPTGGPAKKLWRNFRGFFAPARETTCLWSRWLVLRAVGVVYVFIFAGIVTESRALIGPAGVVPLATYLGQLRQLGAGGIGTFLGAPSLFWLSPNPYLIDALGWLGLVSAVAVVLNFCPRFALGVCWLLFLSFVAAWGEFSAAQLDRLMLETALLCIPFAPAGQRPGLGAASPPRPIALFMMRWLLFRVMFESGLVKLISTDPHWRNLTAMDVMYETSPSPTILGYYAHQLPHFYHLLEIAFTFAAELIAPLLAVFGGRRGRWWALLLWAALQIGIQLTLNFGWLNLAALGLGLLLLDDRMLADAAAKLRLGALGRFLASRMKPPGKPAGGVWGRYGLRFALGLHFGLTLYYFARVCGLPEAGVPAAVAAPVKWFEGFRSANGYSLYAYFEPAHYQVDFEGSNDGGRNWRVYEYRHLPQRPDRITPFLAPWFPRFEATIQIQSWSPGQPTILPLVAARLLERSPEVMGRFARDPFPDRRPTIIRMRRYRLVFTDLATRQRTGNFWRKEFAGTFQPAVYRTPQGGVEQFDLTEADAALKAGNARAALEIFAQQYQLGNLDAGYRLADAYARGPGIPAEPGKAFALLTELAARGESRAQHNLGACYEYGVGVKVDYAKAAELYARAAEQGELLSIYARGLLSAEDHLTPQEDREGLTMLLRAADRTDGDPALLARIRQAEPALARHLMERMTPADIAQAKERAAAAR